MGGRQLLAIFMLLYCHRFVDSILTWWNLAMPKMKALARKRLKGYSKFAEFDREREAECGICLEPCTKMVLPNCCHSMCMNCYRDWNMRSESCPFCRGSLKRVKSKDLWVLTSNDEVVDPDAVSKEDLLRFYLYIKSLPKNYPDALFLMYYEYLI
nr:E3 ubiquitin-protein ligase AIRP2-like [Ipomoea batatas]GMD98098.1 E3 ubiquitin-protein ligase AIRP2-like [Ipomoea batatas]